MANGRSRRNLSAENLEQLMKENPHKFDEYWICFRYSDGGLTKAPLLNKLKDKMHGKISQTFDWDWMQQRV